MAKRKSALDKALDNLIDKSAAAVVKRATGWLEGKLAGVGKAAAHAQVPKAPTPAQPAQINLNVSKGPMQVVIKRPRKKAKVMLQRRAKPPENVIDADFEVKP